MRQRALPQPKRQAGRRLLSWADAEVALGELAVVERRLAEIESAERQAVAEAQAQAEGRRKEPLARLGLLAEALERFCRGELGSKKRGASVLSWGQVARSRRLAYGWVGYRRAHAVRIQSTAAALRALEKTAVGHGFVRMQAAIDRERLRIYLLGELRRKRNGGPGGLGGDTAAARLQRRLRRAGVRLEQREHWFYKLDWVAQGHWG